MCLELYNKRITYSPENEQYNQIVENVIIPWIKMDFERAKDIYKKFPQFFAKYICTPHAVQIINSFVDFIT